MKNTIRLILAVGCLATLAAGSALRAADQAEKPMPPASIRPQGEVAVADLPALAKLNFQQATAAALAAAPGSVIKAELEVEDGNLVYSFEVVGADKAITEVEVDAGNGQILATGKESGEKKDEKSEMKKEKKKEKNKGEDEEDEPKSDKKKEKDEDKEKD